MLGQSFWRLTSSGVPRSPYEEGPGKHLPFSVENKQWLLALVTLHLGSGCAIAFFIVDASCSQDKDVFGNPGNHRKRSLLKRCRHLGKWVKLLN